MNYNRLPARRAERRVIFVLDETGIDSLAADPKAYAILGRQDAAIVNAGADLDKADEVTRSIERQGLLVPGSVLVVSPYKDGYYASLEEAADRFGLEKWAYMSTLCAYLGALRLSVKVVEDARTHSRIEARLHGGKGPVSASVDGATSRLEHFAGQLSWEDRYSGGSMDIARAEAYLEESGLEADPEIRSLVEARAHPGNLLSKRTVTVDLNRESQRTIDAALKIHVPAFMQLDGTFKRAAESQARFRVTVEIEFAPSNS